MLDILFNDNVSVRRVTGARDGHGKAALQVLTEQTQDPDNESATDAPLFIECFIDRRRRLNRSTRENIKRVDATLYYNAGEAPVRLLDDDLVVVESTGETFRVESLHEQVSGVEGTEYAIVGLVRNKTTVVPNAAGSEDV